MATVKAFSDLEQSKKLAEILPFESTDMQYISFRHKDDTIEWIPQLGTPSKYDIPCWSLAALYHILPNNECISTTLSRGGWEIEQPEYVDKWWCEYEDENDHTRDIIITADNPVDACVEMIIKLKERDLL